MGSLIDELQRREAAVRAQAEELRGQIVQLTEQLAGVEAQLARLVTAREVVDEVLDEPGSTRQSGLPVEPRNLNRTGYSAAAMTSRTVVSNGGQRPDSGRLAG